MKVDGIGYISFTLTVHPNKKNSYW